MSTFNTLRQLFNIIGDALNDLETSFSEKNLDWPSLDEPFAPGAAESAAAAIQCVQATNKIVAAAEQITATVRGPAFTVFYASMIYQLPSCLRFAEYTHVVEILREAGSQGLHIDEIAARSDQSALRLGHALRFLATHHIFREVKPDVFTNNRVSSVIDTGMSVKDILADPAAKYDTTDGMAAWIEYACDDTFKSSAYMTDTYTDPRTKHSVDPSQAPFQRAFNVETTYYPWLESINKVKRFGVAMNQAAPWATPDSLLQGFPWGSLPKDSLLVDVAGGVGSASLEIAKVHPHIRVVVQDRAEVHERGRTLWKAELPDALSSGQVQFQVHDFFGPQPQRDASVFLLRHICHDWPDEFAIKILKHLRDAAQPYTRLIVAEHIVPYACPDDTDASSLPGAVRALAPAPLLANLGRASGVTYELDFMVQVLFNAQERTLNHTVSMLNSAGWKAINVYRVGDSYFSCITAEIVWSYQLRSTFREFYVSSLANMLVYHPCRYELVLYLVSR